MQTAEPFLSAAESAPSLSAAAFRLALGVVVIGLAAWAWVYWQKRIKGPTRNLEILERAFLTRGASVALVRIEDQRLLVGVSAEGVRLLRDLGSVDEEASAFAGVLAAASDFAEDDR